MVYQYTAVGDSLTFGLGAFPGSGFVPLYRRLAEEHLGQFVGYDNFGINGLTSGGLYEQLTRDPFVRNRLSEAQLITLSIGGNDLIRAAKSAGGRTDRKQLERSLNYCKQKAAASITAIRRLKENGRQPYVLRAVGLYNPYPEWTEAGEYVMRYNEFIGARVTTADVYSRFAGREKDLLSLDGLHPNSRGHQVIAEQLDLLGYKSLRRS